MSTIQATVYYLCLLAICINAAPPYNNSANVVQKFLLDCLSTGVSGDENYIYTLCSNQVYSLPRNSISGLVEGTSVNDYNGTNIAFPYASNCSSISSSGKSIFIYDGNFCNIDICQTNPLISCTSGVQTILNSIKVGGISVDQYGFIWISSMVHGGSSCCTTYYDTNVVSIYDTNNNLVASFNFSTYEAKDYNTPVNVGGILVSSINDHLFVSVGMNVTSYIIQRNNWYIPVGFQTITSYAQTTDSSSCYKNLSYNNAGEVVAVSTNGYVLIIPKDGGSFYFPLPAYMIPTNGIWIDPVTSYAFITSKNYLYIASFPNITTSHLS